jgi:hypothetical protein
VLERNYRRCYNAAKPSSTVFKMPVMSQCSTNGSPVRHHSLISFLENMMPPKDYSDLNCLVQVNHRCSLHPKQFDDEFSGIVRPFNDQWGNFQQEFLSCSNEEKARRLAADPGLRLQMTQLTKYLEPYQIMDLRALFPTVQEGNLIMELRQQHHLPQLRQRIEGKLAMVQAMCAGKPQAATPNTKTEEEDTCIICCEDKTRIAFPCGHTCCCGACSKSLAQCPLCRAPLITKNK